MSRGCWPSTAWTCATPIPAVEIPGSYWGGSEAGLQGGTLYARADTPVHSILHEAAHFICMSPERRVGLDRDAGGDDAEEHAVCYLQVLLADRIRGFGRETAWSDMDAWGYSFRLGATRSLVRAGLSRGARLARSITASSTPPARLPGGCAPPRA